MFRKVGKPILECLLDSGQQSNFAFRIFSELTSAPDGFLTSQTMQRDLQCQSRGIPATKENFGGDCFRQLDLAPFDRLIWSHHPAG